MKLLLDECVTRHLKRDLASHEVHTVEDAGFKGLENGDLLKGVSLIINPITIRIRYRLLQTQGWLASRTLATE